MKQQIKSCLLVVLLGLIPTAIIHAQNTVVTYQGRVQSGGNELEKLKQMVDKLANANH